MTKQLRPAKLGDRIDELRAEIDSLIDARVAAIARQNAGVPAGVIRKLLTARAPSCQCTQYLQLCGDANSGDAK